MPKISVDADVIRIVNEIHAKPGDIFFTFQGLVMHNNKCVGVVDQETQHPDPKTISLDKEEKTLIVKDSKDLRVKILNLLEDNGPMASFHIRQALGFEGGNRAVSDTIKIMLRNKSITVHPSKRTRFHIYQIRKPLKIT